jgi:hypothetical protein
VPAAAQGNSAQRNHGFHDGKYAKASPSRGPRALSMPHRTHALEAAEAAFGAALVRCVLREGPALVPILRRA